VLRDIEGDFIAQVKVSGNVEHSGRGLSERYVPYHGAGSLLLVDGRTYVRLERAAIAQPDGGGAHYANFELRKEGSRMSNDSREIPNRDFYLRWERRGGQVIGSVSQDGRQWLPLEPIAVELPKRVKLGVVAVNTSSDPFKAEFTEWEVFIKEKGWANP
jgi:regulation of enolase protein 1 (concanavalin A-like superfamily)